MKTPIPATVGMPVRMVILLAILLATGLGIPDSRWTEAFVDGDAFVFCVFLIFGADPLDSFEGFEGFRGSAIFLESDVLAINPSF